MKSVFQFDPEEVEWVPEDYCCTIDLSHLFPSDQPLQIDVGSGEGSFLLAMAIRYPEYNFLGIERLLGRVRKSSRKIAKAGLRNVRLLRLESRYAIRWMLPPQSVQTIHVSFPDPWPKRKHLSRRLLDTAFFDIAHTALNQEGELRLTTDHTDYFKQMQIVAKAHEGFSEMEWQVKSDYPQTDFERRFRVQNLPVYRLRLRKVSFVKKESASNPSL